MMKSLLVRPINAHWHHRLQRDISISTSYPQRFWHESSSSWRTHIQAPTWQTLSSALNFISKGRFRLMEDKRAHAVEEVRGLAIVGRTWRDIINGTPQLWTTFRFIFASGKKFTEDPWNTRHFPYGRNFHFLSTHRFQLARERSKAQLLDWCLD
jgi:hypothetical protein